jgi:hypothetical protein
MRYDSLLLALESLYLRVHTRYAWRDGSWSAPQTRLVIMHTFTDSHVYVHLEFCRLQLQPSKSTHMLIETMRTTILHVLALLGAAQAQNQTRGAAMMRFACSQLTVERLDPLVNPGLIGSPHTHQIVGGNSFKAEMRAEDYDLVAQSTCTTCTFSEDFRYVPKKWHGFSNV